MVAVMLGIASMAFSISCAGVPPQDPRALAAAGAAYAAKRIGSAVLVGQRDIESVMAEEFAVESALDAVIKPQLRVEVDRAAGVVEVTLGPACRRAVLRPGYGVTLLPEGADRLPALPAPRPHAMAVEKELWPMGERIPPLEDGEGLDSRALAAALDAAMAEPAGEGPRKRTRALVVLHRGQLVAERYGPGFDATSVLEGWSMAKSVLSALVGVRVARGGLALDRTALLAEWASADDPRRDISLLHMLQMGTGLEWKEDYSDVAGDVARALFLETGAGSFAADRPLVAAPGTTWSYSSGTSNALSLVLRRSFDRDADYWRFPREALFAPLGMRSATFELDPSGTYVGSSFLWATARDWARFGLLYAQDGVWEGRRILPEGWVARSTAPAPAADRGRYGMHWWLNRGRPDLDGPAARRVWPDLPGDLFWADGFEGQMVAVFPTQQVVVVRLGCTKDGRLFPQAELLRAIYRAFS